MDVMNIASMATDMSMVHMQTEAAVKVLKLADNTAEQEGAALVKMMAAMNGIGQNIDISV